MLCDVLEEHNIMATLFAGQCGACRVTLGGKLFIYLMDLINKSYVAHLRSLFPTLCFSYMFNIIQAVLIVWQW